MQDVHLFVFDGLSDWEIGYATAGINNPQFQKDPGRYRIQSVAVNTELVQSVGGLRIQPDLALAEIDPSNSAMLILPGGTAWEEGKNTEAIDLAKRFTATDKPVAAICGATVGMANSGLLNSRKHTSNAPEYLSMTAYQGIDLYVESPAVSDGNIITASGISPIEFAYEVFKTLDLYSTPVLEAWFKLCRTGQAKYFSDLMTAVNSGNE